MKSKLKIILFKILKFKPKLPPTLTLSIGLYYFSNEKSRLKIGGGVNVNILFVILIKWASLLLFLPNEWVFSHLKFKKYQHIGKSVVVFLKCLKEPKYADFWLHLQFNKGLFCHFGTTEVNKKLHFFLVLTKDSKNKEKI